MVFFHYVVPDLSGADFSLHYESSEHLVVADLLNRKFLAYSAFVAFRIGTRTPYFFKNTGTFLFGAIDFNLSLLQNDKRT